MIFNTSHSNITLEPHTTLFKPLTNTTKINHKPLGDISSIIKKKEKYLLTKSLQTHLHKNGSWFLTIQQI
jgi:hypothetical protein